MTATPMRLVLACVLPCLAGIAMVSGGPSACHAAGWMSVASFGKQTQYVPLWCHHGQHCTHLYVGCAGCGCLLCKPEHIVHKLVVCSAGKLMSSKNCPFTCVQGAMLCYQTLPPLLVSPTPWLQQPCPLVHVPQWQYSVH